MRIIDPGHSYELFTLDDANTKPFINRPLVFVKREGPGYPGNVGSHPGTNSQDVARCLIDRTRYVDFQKPHPLNTDGIRHLREFIWCMEQRAAEIHDRVLSYSSTFYGAPGGIESRVFCPKCGHIGCTGDCRSHQEARP